MFILYILLPKAGTGAVNGQFILNWSRNMSEMCSMHLNKMTAMILDFIVYLSQQKDIEKIVDELKKVDRAVFYELVVNAMEKNPSHTSTYCAEQLWNMAPLTSLALLDWLNNFNEFYV
jgi:hypothetical protein